MSFYEEGESLGALITSIVLDNWKPDYEVYWDLHSDEPLPEDWETSTLQDLAKLEDRLAQVLYRWIRALTPEVEKAHLLPKLKEALPVLHKPSGTGVFRQRLEIELAEDLAGDLDGMTDRALDLLGFVAIAEGERTQAYLSRVADCYLRGMPTEGAVMCRAVLEAALTERLEKLNVTEAMIRKNVPNCGRHVTLIHQMTFAKNRTNLLPNDDPNDHGISTYKAATDVKEAGDDAVHASPGLSDFKEVLAKLVRVLNRLYGAA